MKRLTLHQVGTLIRPSTIESSQANFESFAKALQAGISSVAVSISVSLLAQYSWCVNNGVVFFVNWESMAVFGLFSGSLAFGLSLAWLTRREIKNELSIHEQGMQQVQNMIRAEAQERQAKTRALQPYTMRQVQHIHVIETPNGNRILDPREVEMLEKYPPSASQPLPAVSQTVEQDEKAILWRHALEIVRLGARLGDLKREHFIPLKEEGEAKPHRLILSGGKELTEPYFRAIRKLLLEKGIWKAGAGNTTVMAIELYEAEKLLNRSPYPIGEAPDAQET